MRVFLKHLSSIPRVRDEDINKAFLRNLGSFNDHLLNTHMTSRNRVCDFHLKTSVSPSSSLLGTDVFAGYLRLRGSNVFMYRSRILKIWSRKVSNLSFEKSGIVFFPFVVRFRLVIRFCSHFFCLFFQHQTFQQKRLYSSCQAFLISSCNLILFSGENIACCT